ncbi:uncharacterized protein G2W53_030305 [Senna tora]|uniref:Uncharacterized protein n=1 Tax=Senna tora TaxID=362788 RepID=A0A834WEH1_9FABA|nr:uncharacterized protein G2W53_030305 [Senna tora]
MVKNRMRHKLVRKSRGEVKVSRKMRIQQQKAEAPRGCGVSPGLWEDQFGDKVVS